MKAINEIHGFQLVELESPVYGGKFAIMHKGKVLKDGYCYDAANDFMRCIKQVVEKHIYSTAGALLAAGLTPSKYSQKRAKELMTDCVTPVFIHRLISDYSREIRQEMCLILHRNKKL